MKGGLIISLFVSIWITICAGIQSEGYIPPGWSRKMKQSGRIDMEQLRQVTREKGIDSGFFHVKEIMSALSRGQRDLELNLEQNEVDMSLLSADGAANNNNDNNEAFFKQFLHKTNVKYKLMGEDVVKKYMSLDESHHAQSIREIDSDKVVHCPAIASAADADADASTGLRHTHLQEGDIIVASEHGAHVHSHETSPASLLSFMRSDAVTRNQGFKLIRRVVSVHQASASASASHCKTYMTEDLAALDLFHSFSIDTVAQSPFQYTSHMIDESDTNHGGRRLACTPGAGEAKDVQKDNSNLVVNLSADKGCVSFTKKMPGSISINYSK